MLGACRGMQILNVALGGTLHQHLPDVIGTTPPAHAGLFGDHEVRLEPGSLAARAVGAERTIVKSHHHQGIAELGEGLVATGWSPDDELVEAIELPGEPYVARRALASRGGRGQPGNSLAGRSGTCEGGIDVTLRSATQQ